MRSGSYWIIALVALFCYPDRAPAQDLAMQVAWNADARVGQPGPSSLFSMLDQLGEKHQVFFTYDHKLLEKQEVPEAIPAISQDLETSVKSLLEHTNLTYKKVGHRNYIIVEKPVQPEQGIFSAEKATPMPPVAGSLRALPSRPVPLPKPLDITVRGQVTDESGEPLIGATVQSAENAGIGTITDFDGRYELTLPDGDGTLVFSYTGYQSLEVDVANRTEINVTLAPQAEIFDEVVVIGYGTQRKSDLTGAVSSLNDEDFNPGAIVSVDQMMQGRAAGVQISQTSAEPGGGMSIRIRGASSINAGNEPLYVIDGLPIDNSSNLAGSANAAGLGGNNNPRNPLNALNPADIESIEILKDASATAIYGSRGANGVIMITTKKGREGAVSVNYNMYGGTQSVYKTLDILNARDYIAGMNGIAQDLGEDPIFSPEDISRIGQGTDWQEEIYRTAPVWNHNLSASGGDEKTRFFTSLNYFDQQGVIKNSGIEKYIGRLNLERQFGERLQFGVNLTTSLVKDNNNVDGININEAAGPLYTALLYDPTEPIFDEDGGYNQSPNLTINNPVSLVEGVFSEAETNRTFGSIYAQFDITHDLNAKINFGSDRQTVRRDIYNSTATFNGASAGGIANVASLERSNALVEYTMTYDKALSSNTNLTVLGGITYQNFITRSFSGNITTFPSDNLRTNNLSLGDTGNDGLGSNKEVNSLLSYLGRVNLTLGNRFLFTATLRADGSSRFGENNKYGYFPSFAAGWKLAEEAFIPEFFDDLKLRASWGQTGNQEIGNYASQLTFGPGTTAVFNDAPFGSTNPSRIANPDLKWETTEQFDIGIDASIVQGRVTLTLDYFIKKTKDMLFNVPLPRATGYASILSNIGEMENKGFELLLNSTNILTPSFKWSMSLNFSAIKNKVTDLGDLGDIVTGSIQDVGNTSVIRVGEPVASYLGYEIDGIFQTESEVAESAQPNSQPGYPIFHDTNGDGVISPADQQIIGDPFPDFTYGFNNSFSFKGLQLDVFLQGQHGGELLNINVIESMYPANFRRNRLAEQINDRWTPNNTDAEWPSAVNPFAYGPSKVTTLLLQNATYFRLKNVQLSYQLPVQNISWLNSLRIYVTGQNLVTITDYAGFDPEANAFGRSNVKIDYNGYPLARTWLFGLDVGF